MLATIRVTEKSRFSVDLKVRQISPTDDWEEKTGQLYPLPAAARQLKRAETAPLRLLVRFRQRPF